MRVRSLFLILAASPCLALERLPYNNPGLAVDLGVGLWAWPVPCDADGDGDFDLMVSCPDKPSNGIYLFENTTGDTAKHKLPVFKAPKKIGPTLRYVTPSYLGGKLRVTTPGFEHPNFEKTGVDEKVPLPVNLNFYKPEGKAGKGPKMRHKQWGYADYDGDGRADLVAAMEDWSHYGWDNAYDTSGKWTNGPLRGFVYVQRGTGDGKYADPVQIMADGTPLETFGCATPNFVNCDDDDDLDLICGEFLDGFTYFENLGTTSEPRYSKGKRIKAPDGAEVKMDLEMIVPVAFDWDKDGDADLIVGDEDGRVAFVENLGKVKAGEAPQFAQPVYFKQEAETLKCGALATPVGVDWDSDGDMDIVSGNTAGYIEFFENRSGPKVSQPSWAAPVRLQAGGNTFRILAGPNGSIQGPAEAKWGYTTLNVADWNGDGKKDILVNSILGNVIWLENQGSAQKPVLAAPQPIRVAWNGPQPALAWGWRKPEGDALLTQWRTTPLVYDFTGDGKQDLAILDQEGYLALFERSETNTLKAPRRVFLDEKGQPLQLNPGKDGKSGRRKLCVVDWDQDGKFDLLLNSANADFLRQIDAKDGTWSFQNVGTLAPANIEGHDVSPAVVDFDGNGKPDFLGGAEDGRLYFLANPKNQ
jgi:hypothetical protein